MWCNALMKTSTDPDPIDMSEFNVRLASLITKLLPDQHALPECDPFALDTQQMMLTMMVARPPLNENDSMEDVMTWWAYEFSISCLKYAGWLNPLAEFYLRRAESAVRFMK